MYENNENKAPVPEIDTFGSGERKEKRSGMSVGGIIALALCCAILGGIAGAAGSQLMFRNGSAEAAEPALAAVTETVEDTAEPVTTPESAEAPAAVPAATAAPTQPPTEAPGPTQTPYSAAPASESSGPLMSTAEVYAANVDSTVGIITSVATNYWGYSSTSAASGSGFILTEDGYILTNYHVIEDAVSVTVTTYDNKSYAASVVGYDASNDIAVLKIEASRLHPVTLGSSSSLRVGDTVLAIGNPLGELTFSLTQGVVSALNREVTLSSGVTMDLIQTDTAINSGNSGGALFNLYGEVVGITNAKYSGSYFSSSASIDNIGFAIPIDHVRGIVESIINTGYVVKPYIGVSVVTVSSEMQSYNFPAGAAVKVVNDGSPAAEAGLRVNDIITAADGTAITTSSELKNIVGSCSPGDSLVLTVYRQDEGTIEISVTVGEQRQSSAETGEQPSQSSPYGNGYGFGYGGDFGNGFGFGNGGNYFGNN